MNLSAASGLCRRPLRAGLLLRAALGAIWGVMATTAMAQTTPPIATNGDTTYLMSAFPATAQDRMSLFRSFDGTTFATLSTDAYKPAKGLLRDPSIIHADDGYYYVAYTTAWDGHSFGVARSRDLTRWDAVGDVDISLPGITNTRAPEWLRDRDGQVYIVLSLSKGGTKGPFGAYLIKAVDLATARFEAPVAMDGLQGNYIDTFPVVYSQSYGAFVKNETTKTIEFAMADTLAGPWTIRRRGDWAGWGTWIEGTAAVAVKNAEGKDGWRVYFDDYITKRYWYSDSYDGMRTWTKRAEVGGVSGAVRHVTVIAEPTTRVAAATAPKTAGQAVTWDAHSLLIDGKRVMIWSGEFHPFRLPSPSLWRDVLQKMKATGYNAVSLYFDWGYHSSAPGAYDFSGVRDMELAIKMAEEEGLYVIARPGPYVNADLTLGGFPGYMARQKGVARTDDPEYLKAVYAWMTQIDAIVARHQITTGGGKVIAVQIENEPGLTGDAHKRYMQHLADKTHADGITVPLFHNAASGLPHWTPASSTAPGPLDLYAFDGYPGGGCTNTRDTGRPDKVPNRGLYGEIPPGADPVDPAKPIKTGGSGFDFWGSIGSYDCTAKRTGPGYVKTVFGSSLANGLSIHNVYMAYGGTSWGWLPASVVYSSYDYGAGIDEARNLREKAYALKQMGQFAQAAAPLLSAMDKAPQLTSTSANVKLYHNRSPEGRGDLVFAIHEPTDGLGDDAFAFDLTTRDGSYLVPQAGTLRLNGQDAKLLVADYALERQHVVYTTSQLQTHLRQGPRDIALFYGPRGEDGETVLRFKSKPTVTVMSGQATVTWDAKRHDLRLDYVHRGMIRVRIDVNSTEQLELLLAEDEVARTFWRQDTPQGAVLERSNALIRTAHFDGGTLRLTGDAAEASTIEIWAPQAVDTVTFNGQAVAAEPLAGALWVKDIAGPAAVTLPDLMAAQWMKRRDSQEADPKFDDSQWRNADLTVSAGEPVSAPVLAMSDYGFHHGDVWYRGRFKVRGQSPETLNLTFNGGSAGVVQVWLDGRFMGEREGAAGEARPKTTTPAHFYLPKLKTGEHVLSVMVRNNGHNGDQGADDEHKEARGLIEASLRKTPITWKIQGNQGGELISDLVRGPMNNGGLYGERNGWYLPVDPFAEQTGWELGAVDDDPPAPGTYWLRTRFKLNLPKDQDVQLGLVFGDADVPRTRHRTRILIFVNGWHVGNFIGHVGPQRTFILPPGIVNNQGDNTLTFAVTTDGKPDNAPEPVKLVVLRNVRGGVPVDPVPQPVQNQR